MFRGSLCEKLTGEFEDIKADEEEIIYLSVANNLSNIFSTNVGNAEACLTYGKPELNDINISLTASLNSIAESFGQTIMRYEPRLSHVEVAATVSETNLSKIMISIRGILSKGKFHREVEYTAYMSGDGIIEVQK